MDEITKYISENQNLKELIEVAKHITSDLNIKKVIKNVIYYLFSKYSPESSAIIIPKDFDDDSPVLYYYEGINKKDHRLNFKSIEPLLDFFSKQEYNYITFEQFKKEFKHTDIIEELKALKPEFIVPMKSESLVIGVYFQSSGLNKSPDGTMQLDIMQDTLFCITILNFASIAIENAVLFRKATVDRMTKLYTHHTFREKLSGMIQESRKTNRGFSLVMFDIDHFKKFNDNFGHLQGDFIIKELSRLFISYIREQDVAARYGGEEFVVILPDVDSDAAYEYAEKLRIMIQDHKFQYGTTIHNVTISIGVAEYSRIYVSEDTDIIKAADDALYASKQGGRNRVNKGMYR